MHRSIKSSQVKSIQVKSIQVKSNQIKSSQGICNKQNPPQNLRYLNTNTACNTPLTFLSIFVVSREYTQLTVSPTYNPSARDFNPQTDPFSRELMVSGLTATACKPWAWVYPPPPPPLSAGYHLHFTLFWSTSASAKPDVEEAGGTTSSISSACLSARFSSPSFWDLALSISLRSALVDSILPICFRAVSAGKKFKRKNGGMCAKETEREQNTAQKQSRKTLSVKHKSVSKLQQRLRRRGRHMQVRNPMTIEFGFGDFRSSLAATKRKYNLATAATVAISWLRSCNKWSKTMSFTHKRDRLISHQVQFFQKNNRLVLRRRSPH